MSVSDQPYILALDEGTTNAKAILVNGRQHRQRASRPVSSHIRSRPGSNSRRTMGAATLSAARCWTAYQHHRLPFRDHQPALNRCWRGSASGEPLGPCITWQCKRSAPFVRSYASAGWKGRSIV